jgi:hypothetical protein
MLSVDTFYHSYDCAPGNGEHMELLGKQVICYEDRLYIICLDPHADPFNWLSMAPDGIVFQTQSGYLAIMLIFDGEEEQTAQAIAMCNQVVGL